MQTSPLWALIAVAEIRWVLMAAPRELLGVPWVPPLVDRAVSGARFNQFARATGIELRALSEAIVAACAPAPPKAAVAEAAAIDAGVPAGGPAVAAPGAPVAAPSVADAGGGAPAAAPAEDVMFYLARHAGDAATIERSFRGRFTSSEKRAVDRPDLVRVSGKVGLQMHTGVFLGSDVAGFQEGGSVSRGPARIAALFAQGKLKASHAMFAGEPLRSLALRLGAAPLAAFAPGPFEGELARGLRGLLGAATALGAVLRPSVRQGFFITVAVAGDFSTSAGPASSELLAAWNDLAGSRLGHMLGLDAPMTAPAVTTAPDALMLSVELSGTALAEGLAKATASRVEDIFK